MDNNNFTNEEIWNFLKNKMKKNGLTSKVSVVNAHIDDYPNNGVEIINAYYESDVINAIALAYRSGYLRAIKGRPFMIGEKKKKSGRWEPVDPENLPKEGTKVRYARECRDYSDNGLPVIKIGDTGCVDVVNDGWFGMTLDNPRSFCSWIAFDDNGTATSLDMWVEDDE